MDEEEAIGRITRLLEMGGTMLATHHDCGAPLFRYKGNIVCPVCSFDEVGDAARQQREQELSDVSKPETGGKTGEKPDAGEHFPTESAGLGEASAASEAAERGSRRIGEIEEIREPTVSPEGVVVGGYEPDLVRDDLQRTILHKIREISKKMVDEQDLGRLKEQLESVERALKVLALLER